ncbi:PREDICTED: uncharacterized protein LOC107346225 [Acropora digitifera]|uniref:uncharacterized protein LOC107346225 n=1 Tax=Acropora digitifera TaxID=70779 RepID=UPI00077AF545|nr:PREDICTED: uncharacterized protein LOC107346225 [Acropora digitifera]
MNWDVANPSDCLPSVQRWLEELPALEQFSVRRCYKPEKFGKIANIQIHHFSYASELAYGTISYLRLTSEDERVCCSFLLSKSRLVPLKALSIPRLELNAATLAVKLDRMFRKELELPITSSVFWTDSTSVLRYIRNNDKRFHTFVSNKLTVIHDGSSVDQWRHVHIKGNPSDVTTRGLSAKALLSDEKWKEDPEFLWLEEMQLKNLAQPDDKVFAYYSSWYKLQSSVAYLLHYKAWLLNKVRSKFGQPIAQVPSREVTLTEMKNAEREILMSLQRKFFPKELKQMSNCGQSDRTKSVNNSSSISRLDPILKNGFLLVGGRLRHTRIQTKARSPIILPKKSHVVDLIVRNCHEIFGHVGREHVLSLLREKFWLVKGRATVYRVLNVCFSCRKGNQLPMTQKMADLPHERIALQEPPFTYVGEDCFGPFHVKRGRCLEKRYGVLFTCLTIRPVHVEIARSLDTSSFINALRRFIARRGVPQEIRSDNGTNFTSADKEIRQAIGKWNQEMIKEFVQPKKRSSGSLILQRLRI